MVLGADPTLVLPASDIHSVYAARPESEVDVWGEMHQMIQAPYTVRDRDIYANNFHMNVVRKQITRSLGLLTADLADEIAVAFKEYFGVDCTEWKTVKLWDCLLKIVARASNRVFVGLPLCRNEQYLEYLQKYTTSVFRDATIIKAFPTFSRPLVGPLVTIPGKRYLALCKRSCVPVIVERLQKIDRKQKDASFDWNTPDDVLQWVIEECQKTKEPRQMEPERIAHRLIKLNVVSIASTAGTITNAILDLYSSNPSDGFVDTLREESNRVLAESRGIWTKDALSRLVCMDSAIRESMRFSDFGFLALPRRISAPEGIVLDSGMHIPKGIRLATPMHAIHHDESIYPNPSRYDPFRFTGTSRSGSGSGSTRTAGAGVEEGAADQQDTNRSATARYSGKSNRVSVRDSSAFTAQDTQNDDTPDAEKIGREDPSEKSADYTPSTQTRPQQTQQENNTPSTNRPQQNVLGTPLELVKDENVFLGFGRGRYACPGRFFAAQQMKLVIAYLVQWYDVESMAERPKLDVMVEVRVPSQTSQIRVRRRLGNI
ncbi:MAG: hypothetical protein M1831_002872 [Alyxoria varia]|nr:MAG: hypothetical protein M1831_002872 [Alyxoria varia]